MNQRCFEIQSLGRSTKLVHVTQEAGISLPWRLRDDGEMMGRCWGDAGEMLGEMLGVA